ncbi:hypothetical protein [Leptospira bandrabouensis]|uniref:hypothetical protein n=1 Tax=Leptospira bandrabouensis TaxID=2484903 RepID=UPI001EE809AB|nr:hypothetical protein [Leptospira bandrabouensis]MCG6146509.1 hypothetical protein [Leptospira bandrabouensis]MCG6161881.1 hypothetical protein [Leptospira bandrabouensis]MCG6166068.1 hypothetical protein [Leptospira bandrabouensis]
MNLALVWEGLKKVFKFLVSIWNNLPRETKEKIIDHVLKIWEPILSKYYDSKRN